MLETLPEVGECRHGKRHNHPRRVSANMAGGPCAAPGDQQLGAIPADDGDVGGWTTSMGWLSRGVRVVHHVGRVGSAASGNTRREDVGRPELGGQRAAAALPNLLFTVPSLKHNC